MCDNWLLSLRVCGILTSRLTGTLNCMFISPSPLSFTIQSGMCEVDTGPDGEDPGGLGYDAYVRCNGCTKYTVAVSPSVVFISFDWVSWVVLTQRPNSLYILIGPLVGVTLVGDLFLRVFCCRAYYRSPLSLSVCSRFTLDKSLCLFRSTVVGVYMISTALGFSSISRFYFQSSLFCELSRRCFGTGTWYSPR